MPYSYATHLECSSTGERYDIGQLQGLSAARKPLLARYDLAGLARDLTLRVGLPVDRRQRLPEVDRSTEYDEITP